MGFLGVEFYKYAAFKLFLGVATQANGVGGTEPGEEGFDVELGGWFFVAKTFSIDTFPHCIILCDFFDLVHRFAFGGFRKGDLSLDSLVIVDYVECSTFFKSCYDGRQWLEMTHAFEGVNDADGDWKIVMTLDFLEEEVVLEKVGVREVKFDLLADLYKVTALLLCSEVCLDVLSIIDTGLSWLAFTVSIIPVATLLNPLAGLLLFCRRSLLLANWLWRILFFWSGSTIV